MKYSTLSFLMASCLLLLALAGCGAQLTERERAIDSVLLQPVEIPLGWTFEWFNRSKGGCKGRWNSFSHGDLEPNLAHVIFDCPTEAAAKALYAQRSGPFGNATRTAIGAGQKPASSDEFAAWCDVPALKRQLNPTQVVSERFCVTLARYGRVISDMRVSAILPTTTWPLETDLLKWTVERNDERLARLPE